MEAQLLIDNERRPAKTGANFERRHPRWGWVRST